MFPLWFALLDGSFVFFDIGLSILFLVFPYLGALVNLWLARFHQPSPVLVWGKINCLSNLTLCFFCTFPRILQPVRHQKVSGEKKDKTSIGDSRLQT
jgi:hypothetical protein